MASGHLRVGEVACFLRSCFRLICILPVCFVAFLSFNIFVFIYQKKKKINLAKAYKMARLEFSVPLLD